MLAARQPMLIWRGSEFIQFHNDACASLLGARHLWRLGKPAKTIWPVDHHVIRALSLMVC
jgi:hypothetical protein